VLFIKKFLRDLTQKLTQISIYSLKKVLLDFCMAYELNNNKR
jgi:hypothetical protein